MYIISGYILKDCFDKIYIHKGKNLVISLTSSNRSYQREKQTPPAKGIRHYFSDQIYKTGSNRNLGKGTLCCMYVVIYPAVLNEFLFWSDELHMKVLKQLVNKSNGRLLVSEVLR